MNLHDLLNLLDKAQDAAWIASNDYFQDKLNGVDQPMCGFAWVEFEEFEGKKITGRTKFGKLLKEAGIEQNYNRKFYLWNPSHFPAQNVDVLFRGAIELVKILDEHGIKAVAHQRLD